jgi:hypothetical protein
VRVANGRIVHEQTYHHGWHKMFIAIRERRSTPTPIIAGNA